MKHSFYTYNTMKHSFFMLLHDPYFIRYLQDFNRPEPAPIKPSFKNRVIGFGFYLRRKLGITSVITPREAFYIFSLALLAVIVAYYVGANKLPWFWIVI